MIKSKSYFVSSGLWLIKKWCCLEIVYDIDNPIGHYWQIQIPMQIPKGVFAYFFYKQCKLDRQGVRLLISTEAIINQNNYFIKIADTLSYI